MNSFHSILRSSTSSVKLKFITLLQISTLFITFISDPLLSNISNASTNDTTFTLTTEHLNSNISTIQGYLSKLHKHNKNLAVNSKEYTLNELITHGLNRNPELNSVLTDVLSSKQLLFAEYRRYWPKLYIQESGASFNRNNQFDNVFMDTTTKKNMNIPEFC